MAAEQPTQDQAHGWFYEQTYDEISAQADVAGAEVPYSDVIHGALNIAGRRVAAWKAGAGAPWLDWVEEFVGAYDQRP